LTDKDRQYIQAKGIDTIRSHTFDFITTRLAPAFPQNDGSSPIRYGKTVNLSSSLH
jgi:hypothetical protein